MEPNKKESASYSLSNTALVGTIFTLIAALAIMLFCISLNTDQEHVDPYDGVVCMHGVDVRPVVGDNGALGDEVHICDHMAVLRSTDTYTRTFKFEKIEKVVLSDERISMIEYFLEAIENCEDDILVFELSANGIDDWQQFNKDAMSYCANFYPLDVKVAQHFASNWYVEADGRSYVELNIKHCREVIEYCRGEEARVFMMYAAIKEDVSHLDLNGYKVHDLKIIHDFICENTEYDWTLENNKVYNFIMGENIQCAGYARTFEMICNYVGLDVKYVSGMVGTAHHAWNSVVIDRQTYYIDLTWDDTNENGEIIYDYFLTTDSNGSIDRIE